MAFKDWKKLPNDTEWYKEKPKYSYARVWKIGLPAYERKRRKIGAYAFSGRIGRSGITTKKYFKRQAEALNYAKFYMRKN